MPPRKKYKHKKEIDIITAKVLKDSGKKITEIAEIIGCAESTVSLMLHREIKTVHPEQVQAIKKGLAGKMYDNADLAADVVHDKINDLNAYQASIVGKISTETARLMEGQSTSNMVVITADVAEIVRRSRLPD